MTRPRTLLALSALPGLGLLALAALSLGDGCNRVVCGPGTKQVQQSNGDLRCEPAEVTGGGVPCVPDGGVVIRAGQCVSRVQCDPDTSRFDPQTGLCVGLATSRNLGDPPTCPTPDAQHVCLRGAIRNLVDKSFLSEQVTVGLYSNPLMLIGSSSVPPPEASVLSDDKSTYKFENVSLQTNLIVITVTDASGARTVTGVGAQNVNPGTAYQIDAYAAPRSLVAGWTAGSGGIDYDRVGAYLMLFFCDPPQPPDRLTATETLPAAAVTPLQDPPTSVPPAAIRFLDPDLRTINSALTETGPVGAALLPGDRALHVYTAQGGACGTSGWESFPGGSIPGLVLVTRFHAQ